MIVALPNQEGSLAKAHQQIGAQHAKLPQHKESPVGRVPPPGDSVPPPGDSVPPPGDSVPSPGANDVGRVPPRGGLASPHDDSTDAPLPRRLRRLHHAWPDRDGHISYLLTMCVEGRLRVLDNEAIFQRLLAFLLDSPQRYHWLGRRFVIMPDHIHLIAHQDRDAVRLGQWIKALKAVVAGLEPRQATSSPDSTRHPLARSVRSWRWQNGFHDHKFRTPESEARKWEYVCLNPVRAKLVPRPEQWPFAGEIFYHEASAPEFVRAAPQLLETGVLIGDSTPREGARPTE